MPLSSRHCFQAGSACSVFWLHINYSVLAVFAFFNGRHHPEKIDLTAGSCHVWVITLGHKNAIAFAYYLDQLRRLRIRINELHAKGRSRHIDEEVRFLEHARMLVRRP